MTLKNIWGSKNEEGFFRKKIYLAQEPVTAYLRIYVDTGYELFLNGRFVAFVDEWCNTRDYNVRLFLKKGMNQVAVHGINHSGHRGFALEMVVNDKTSLVTDASWKTADQEYWGWMLEEYEDDNWLSARELDLSAAGEPQWWTKPGADPERVIPALDCSQFFRGNIPKTCASPYWSAEDVNYIPDENIVKLLGREYETFTQTPHLPKIHRGTVIRMDDGVTEEKGRIAVQKTARYNGPGILVDFKEETVGFFRMRVCASQPMSFRIHYGETLDEALSEPSRDQCLNRMLHEEYRMFGGVQEFESRMRVAFRFVRVEFFDCRGPVHAGDFSVRTTLYPVARRGYFACDDREITKLWEMGERTLHFCMQEYYLDAPKRDRFLWTGDARLEALVNYYTFGDTKLFEFCWEELARVQMPNGGIPASYGEGCSMLWDYVAWYVIAFYDYLMYTGNLEYVIKHRKSLERAADFLTSLTNAEGIIEVPENPLGNMWMVELNAFVGRDPYLNELYLRCLRIAEKTAELAGDETVREKYARLATTAEPNIMKLLENDSMVRLFDTTVHTQIQYELAERDLENHNVDAMIERIRKYWCAMISPGSDCLHEGTTATGKLPRIDRHYTDTPSFGSYCHGWTAAATVLLPKGVAGVKPAAPGFAAVEIRPVFHVFKWFQCVVPTPKGEIAVKYENDIFSWYVPEEIDTKVIIGEHIVSELHQGVMPIR